MDLQVMETRLVAQDTRSFTLAPADGSAPEPFTAGAHLKLQVPVADGDRKTREYSLVRLSDGRGYEIAVLLEPDGTGGSAAMHRLREGDLLTLEAVANEFELAADARESLLIAGGIGITPILCMARALAASGAAPEFHYAARSAERMAYRDEARALGAVLHIDGGDPARGIPLDRVLAQPREGRHVYVCGPRPLIAAVMDRAAALGWPKDRVHYESFGGAVTLSADKPFRVVLRASGRTLEVAADQTILDALVAAGLDPLHDCKRGECGMCMTTVLAGVPDHRDHALTPAERARGDVICTCVSRSLTPELELDL